jgi:hypothetical protein
MAAPVLFLLGVIVIGVGGYTVLHAPFVGSTSVFLIAVGLMLWGFAGVAAEISQLRRVLKAGLKIRQETGLKIRQEAGINIRPEVGLRPQAHPPTLSALDRAQRDELMDRIDQIARECHLPKRIAAFKAIREHPEILERRSSSAKQPRPLLNGNPVTQAGNGIFAEVATASRNPAKS